MPFSESKFAAKCYVRVEASFRLVRAPSLHTNPVDARPLVALSTVRPQKHVARLATAISLVVFCMMFLRPDVTRAQFLYYSPMTVRALGMGAVASADPRNGTNAWANPAVISGLEHLASTICYRSYSIESTDFRDFSALLGGSYSTPRFGAAAGVAYRRETLELETTSKSEDAYNLLVAAQVVLSQLRFSVGLAQKSYSLPAVADKDRNSVTDIGILAAWRSPTQEHWHFDGSVGFSWMNNGDEVQTTFFGPIQVVSTERYGVWWAVHSPRSKNAVLGETPVSIVGFSVALDAERTTSRSERPRYLFGSEITLWNVLTARGGYVHDEILADGARDAAFGVGVRLSGTHFLAQFDYARFPVMHDLYSNTVGAELSVRW